MVSPPSSPGSRHRGERPISFDAVFRAHLDYVWRVARSIAGDGMADDITQETFLLVRRKLEQFDGPSLRAWLYSITRNVARNALRGHGRQVRRDRQALQPLPSAAAHRWVEIQEAATLMDAFLERLPPPQRQAFMLKELEELTAAEISQATGVAVQTVYSRVRSAHRELERFREELAEPTRPREHL